MFTKGFIAVRHPREGGDPDWRRMIAEGLFAIVIAMKE
jgi:hypothetical protein